MYYIVRFNGILTVMLPCGIGRTLYIGIQITAMLYSYTKFICIHIVYNVFRN